MNRKHDLRAALVLLLVILLGLFFFPTRRSDAMVPADILTIRTVGLTDLSADGHALLYTVGTYDPQTRRRLTSLYRRDLDTGQDLLLFAPADKSWGAVWRPDGQAIAYFRTVGQKTQIWSMDADGGGRRPLGPVPADPGDLFWAPDGSALAWVAGAAVGSYEGLAGQYLVADGIGYRHLDAGYRQGTLKQLFVMDTADTVARRLTDLPLDVTGLSWSPEADALVIAAQTEKDLGWNLNTDLWVVPRQGGEPRQITANPGPDRNPLWLPDGRIAYLRSVDPLWEAAPMAIAVVSPQTGDEGPLQMHGEGFNDRIFRFTAADGRYFALGARRGCLDLLQVQGDRLDLLTDGGHDFWSVKVAGSRAILTGAGQTMPGAIFLVDLAEEVAGPHLPQVLIDPNQAWCRQVGLTEPEPFTVVVDDRSIQGWFFKPQGMAPDQRVPLVLSIHGGPEWMYGGYFLPEFHILPTFGYALVIANPTGSTGYGIEFQNGVRGDWVERPGRELAACVDLAIAQGWADPQRLAVMGGSYGGHLAADLTTRTDRFRAAAVDRMFPDLIGFWGTTDEKWFPEWEFLGRPWQEGARQIYLRNSPTTRVDKVRTPTLISHGMRDYRCLVAGGEIWFSCLQAQGVPARFLRFDQEGHGLRDPSAQVFYQEQLLNWFDRYVLDLVEPDPLEPFPSAALEDSLRHD